MNNYYRGVIWTNHALKRLKERRMTQDLALKAFSSPTKSHKGTNGTTEFVRIDGSTTTTIIAKLNEKYEWVILSCWIEPPLPGSLDIKKKQAYLKYKNSSFWGKLWIEIKKSVFGFEY